MDFQPPEQFNMADYFLDARVREGKGDRPAVLTEAGTLSYREIQALANRFGHVFTEAGVEPEQRIMIALPDGPEFVGALFGTLKIGAAVVMANPQLKPDAIEYFYAYTRARVVVAHRDTVAAFRRAARGARHLKTILSSGTTNSTSSSPAPLPRSTRSRPIATTPRSGCSRAAPRDSRRPWCRPTRRSRTRLSAMRRA